MSELDGLLTWHESSTSGEAIADAIRAARRDGPAARAVLEPAERIVVTGAGSSYYAAITIAAAAREITGRVVAAAPLSELILRPSGVLSRTAADDGAHPVGPDPVVIISRSGATSEALTVARRMRETGHPTIAVTCRHDSPLADLVDVALVAAAADEAAIVMTRSFASMVAMLLAVVADLGGDEWLGEDLDRVPRRWGEALAAADVGRRLGATDRRRVVVLGGGATAGIAAEWVLKLTETSQVPANAYEPLEFRHGPMSVCEPGVLVVGLVGGDGAREELAVVHEAAELGADTWLIGRDDVEVAGAPGETSVIGGGLHPLARLPLLVHPAHALALRLALTRGADPDAPRHLGHVVIIESG